MGEDVIRGQGSVAQFSVTDTPAPIPFLTLGTGVGGDTTEDFAYDALNRPLQAKDDHSIVNLTCDSLSRVLTEVQGRNPLGARPRTRHASRKRTSRGRATNGEFVRPRIGGDTLQIRPSGRGPFAGRSRVAGRAKLKDVPTCNRLTKVLRDVNDPVAELATPNSETYASKLEYDMDDVFNLMAYKVTPYGGSTTTTSYTTDAMNQYTAIGSQSPTYTDAGSLKDDGTLLYKYDAHQHLIEVKLKATNAVVATYAYDALGLGRRIGKVVGSDTTRYVHVGQQAIEEWDGTGSGASLRRLYVFGERIDQIVAMEAPDQADVDSDSNSTEVLRFSFHTQLIGSVTQVTGPAGSVVESYEYDPYGKPTIKDQGGSTVSASAIGNSYLFTGRQLDEETGLYYYRARHYSPEMRRFIQRDPLEYVDGPNAVGYVQNGPMSRHDPLGLKDVNLSDQTLAYRKLLDEWNAPPLERGMNSECLSSGASGNWKGGWVRKGFPGVQWLPNDPRTPATTQPVTTPGSEPGRGCDGLFDLDDIPNPDDDPIPTIGDILDQYDARDKVLEKILGLGMGFGKPPYDQPGMVSSQFPGIDWLVAQKLAAWAGHIDAVMKLGAKAVLAPHATFAETLEYAAREAIKRKVAEYNSKR